MLLVKYCYIQILAIYERISLNRNVELEAFGSSQKFYN